MNMFTGKMKTIGKLLTVLCMSLLATCTMAAHGSVEEGGRYGTLVFDSLAQDMGWIEKDSAAVAVFHFRVGGDAPVLIQCAAAACNCTRVTYPHTPMRPGEEGQIEVRYNSKGMPPGYFRKIIVIRSNAAEPLMKISVSGRVKREKKIKYMP